MEVTDLKPTDTVLIKHKNSGEWVSYEAKEIQESPEYFNINLDDLCFDRYTKAEIEDDIGNSFPKGPKKYLFIEQ